MAAELNEIEKQLVQQCHQFALERKKFNEEKAKLVKEKKLVREAEMKLKASQAQRVQVQSGSIGSLNEFNMDDDWTMWMERFEHYAIINNFDEARKISLFIVLVGPQAYAVLRRLCTPESPANKSIMELDRMMKKHLQRLQPTKSRITKRHKLGERKQAEGQDIEHHSAMLEELLMNCDFDKNLESRLRDLFVRGLQSAAMKKKQLKEPDLANQRAFELATVSESATKSSNSKQPSVCSILDLPNEILVKIILYFNARERLALGKSCQRFNDLVFGDKKLLRNLDFTDELSLTKASDIQKYFDDENTYKKILGINIESVFEVGHVSSSIGKAINLVELNILDGLTFKSVEELSRFLKPLVHLKRLSVNWPCLRSQTRSDDPKSNQVLVKRFSRLTYLSLKGLEYLDKFLLTLQHCQQLEKLSLVDVDKRRYGSPLPQEFMKLSNLKFVKLAASRGLELLRNDIMSIVPDPTEWTDFYPKDSFREIYLERNVEVCTELERVKKMPLPPHIAKLRVPGLIEKGWSLFPQHLLSQVIRVTHEDAPEEFCCLSWPGHRSSYRSSLLKIDEAKKLLKDPEYQISALRFSHCIEKNCDVHLLASAFPNLKELVLQEISNRYSPGKTKTLRRRLKKKESLVSEKHSDAQNTDSSFEILVENTPRLEVLEIREFSGWSQVKDEADVDVLYLISNWKNLTIIRLYGVPIRDARFLIDIGKECKKLEEVTLRNPYPCKTYRESDGNELLEMLHQCENLRKLDISELNVERLSEMFNILSNRSRFVTLYSYTFTKKCDHLELTTSIEKMLRQCQELKRFEVRLWKYQFSDKLRLGVDKVISDLNRPGFIFYVNGPNQIKTGTPMCSVQVL